MKHFIKLHENDNVVVIVNDLKAGAEIADGITLVEDVQAGHKIATKKIEQGEAILKDNFSIGYASQTIEPGTHVHTHNVASNREGNGELAFQPKVNEKLNLLMDREIRVYHRKNWEIGIRNELWILPTVSHVNKTAQLIKEKFLSELKKLEVDGVHVFEHAHGCFQVGDDLESTRKILQNIALHPNTGGVLVLGLGQESNHIEDFKATLGDYDEERIHFITANDHVDEIGAGVESLHQLHELMRHDYRSTSLLRKLKIGLKYGDFDAFTAITAGPLMSALSDYLIRSGGSVVTTELQRMVEASHELVGKIESEEVFQKVVGLAHDFRMPKEYIQKRNGITTLEEKSLGYIKKMGSTYIVDALSYGERLKKRGLNLLESPSNALVSTTALGAAGCQMVLYATSLGTPIGSFVPTVKIATNSELAMRKPNWVDYDAQAAIMTTKEEAVQDFINYICDVASGKWVKNEYEGYREISIWKRGTTL
ncbi:MAG: altronate dehydratase family protein [Turicibacter sp.]|nr:altronate dehydratase family protein [Turicibacter sp.]